jgi:hypothetical protein
VLRRRLRAGFRLTLATTAVMAVFALQYATFAEPFWTSGIGPKERAELAAAPVPDGAKLHVYDPGYRLFLFYLRPPVGYVTGPEGIDAEVRYLAGRVDLLDAPAVREALGPRSPRVLVRFTDRYGKRYRVLKLSGDG